MRRKTYRAVATLLNDENKEIEVTVSSRLKTIADAWEALKYFGRHDYNITGVVILAN